LSSPGKSEAAVVVPARLLSTRLPEKALLSETGKPLIAHVVERALRAKELSEGRIARVVVATDDERIAAAAREAGAEAAMTSSEHASGTDRVAEVAERLSEEVVVNIQGDEPEIDPRIVVKLAGFLPDRDGCEMATLAFRVERARVSDENLVKVVIDSRGRAVYFSRAAIPYHVREDDRTPYYGHIGAYAFLRETLLRLARMEPVELEKTERLEQLRALDAGIRIRVAVVEEAPKGIDTMQDYREFVRRYESHGR
jgi:3-deoxy-manno-octulosonate cytidylyltransferase (CMP-KDO synthetase)